MFGGNKTRGKFDEVNRSIFIYAEKYMSSKVHTMNELEHSARDIDTSKKKGRDLNEEIRETDRGILKKKKMIKSDIHAFQGLEFEASICQRSETKGSIQRRFGSLLKMVGAADCSCFVRFFSRVKQTISALEEKKEKYKSIVLLFKEMKSKFLVIEVSKKKKQDNIVKCELTIEKLSQETSATTDQHEGLVDSVDKSEGSLAELNRLVLDFDKKNSGHKSSISEILKQEMEYDEEVKRLDENYSQRSASMVNEFHNVLRKSFYGGVTQRKKAMTESYQELTRRLEMVRKEIERKKREKLFTTEKLDVSGENNRNVGKEVTSKKNRNEAIQNEKEELKVQNEKYRNKSKGIDEKIPQLFQKIQDNQLTKKKKKEELMIGNSRLESQLHAKHNQSRKKGNAMRKLVSVGGRVSARKSQIDIVRSDVDEVEKLVADFRERLNSCAEMYNRSVSHKNELYQSGQVSMNEIEGKRRTKIQNMKEQQVTEMRNGKDQEMEVVGNGIQVETVEFMKKLELESRTVKESPPIRQLSSNNLSLTFNNMGSTLLGKGEVRRNEGKGIDADLSYLGNDGDFSFVDDEDDERGRKRRKKSNGTFDEIAHTPKEEKKKSENEIGGMSDLELEFNLDDVFGNDSDNSALSTPVRHSTAMSTPHSNGTPNNLLDILNPSTKKKKKKKKKKSKRGKKRLSVIPLSFEETKPTGKSRKRKRKTELRKKKSKKSKKSKKRSKKKVVEESNDLDLEFEDSIDLSVFDF